MDRYSTWPGKRSIRRTSHQNASVSPRANSPRTCAAGRYKNPTGSVRNAAIKLHPASGTASKLLSGDSGVSRPK